MVRVLLLMRINIINNKYTVCIVLITQAEIRAVDFFLFLLDNFCP